ncbi:hypothetical protein DFJ73DRAFT_331065 [Zopfochytrium polystomum]|nr:hypothetical protein DFJ73DRAFT_331065 [Zopfochytrium polystomum]
MVRLSDLRQIDSCCQIASSDCWPRLPTKLQSPPSSLQPHCNHITTTQPDPTIAPLTGLDILCFTSTCKLTIREWPFLSKDQASYSLRLLHPLSDKQAAHLQTTSPHIKFSYTCQLPAAATESTNNLVNQLVLQHLAPGTAGNNYDELKDSLRHANTSA